MTEQNTIRGVRILQNKTTKPKTMDVSFINTYEPLNKLAEKLMLKRRMVTNGKNRHGMKNNKPLTARNKLLFK